MNVLLIILSVTQQFTPDTPGVVARPVQQSGAHPQEGIGPGWQSIRPVREGFYDAKLGKLLSDIESQMPAQHIYRDNDLITWAHETTHGVNSRARQVLPARHNAFYCFYKKIFVLSEPNVTKVQIKEFIPRELHGSVYHLYIENPQLSAKDMAMVPAGTIVETQENIPLHILDEWTAYLNGLEVSQELRLRNSSDGDLEHAVELAGYASALLRCIEKYDPSYRDKAKFISYCNYCLDRTGHYLPSSPKQAVHKHAQLIKQYFSNGGRQDAVRNIDFIGASNN